MKRIYLATRSERAGHWINAVGFVLLALSGFNIHFAREFNVFGTFNAAVAVHNIVGIAVSMNYILWWFYAVGARRIRFFMPERDDLVPGVIRQARFYLLGIFQGDPHPFAEGEVRKFNPLQKWTYLGVMVVLFPIQIVTGLWLFYLIREWQDATSAQLRILGITHNMFAMLLTAFLLGHIYLATTGETPWAHFKMMFTGYAHVDGGGSPVEEGVSDEMA
jgi:thiosulfate reductase cytochrome b subunit